MSNSDRITISFTPDDILDFVEAISFIAGGEKMQQMEASFEVALHLKNGIDWTSAGKERQDNAERLQENAEKSIKSHRLLLALRGRLTG